MGRPALLPALLLACLLGAAPSRAGDEDETSPFECRARAIVVSPDQGLLQVYDGIRKGLELARLPRVCREDLDAEDEVLARLEREPPELLFVLGRAAARRLGERLQAVPRVYVDTAWAVNDEEVPPAPEPGASAAVVRSVIQPVHVAEILREVVGIRPAGRLSWKPATPALEELAQDVALAAGFRPAADDEPAALLHMRFHVGEQPAPLDALLARARAERVLMVSDDLEHWRRGVPVVVVPDFDLLGRIAADAGRELLESPEPPRIVRRRMAVPEVRVDLYAARALGLELPVPFLAGADVLRGPRRKGDR